MARLKMDVFEHNMLQDLKQEIFYDLSDIRRKKLYGRNLEYLRDREEYCLKELNWINKQYENNK